MSDPVLFAGAVVAAGLGLFLLRRAWRSRASGPGAWRLWTGWGALAASVVACAFAAGSDSGTLAGLCLVMATAYGLIAGGVDVRKAKGPARVREGAVELEPGQTRPGAVALRVLVAGPLAGAAAMAVSVAVAVHAPGAPIDRLASAAFLLPFAWGVAMAWAVSDEHLARPAAGLAVLTGVALTLSLTLEMRP